MHLCVANVPPAAKEITFALHFAFFWLHVGLALVMEVQSSAKVTTMEQAIDFLLHVNASTSTVTTSSSLFWTIGVSALPAAVRSSGQRGMKFSGQVPSGEGHTWVKPGPQLEPGLGHSQSHMHLLSPGVGHSHSHWHCWLFLNPRKVGSSASDE